MICGSAALGTTPPTWPNAQLGAMLPTVDIGTQSAPAGGASVAGAAAGMAGASAIAADAGTDGASLGSTAAVVAAE